MDDRHSMTNGHLTVGVLARGAELCSLRGTDGIEAIWQAGDPWTRHAPILFPIIGKVANDRLRVDGRDYPMGQHGFARDRDFSWVYRTDTACRLMLGDDARTRAIFPFAFLLEVEYELHEATLRIAFTLTNTGDAALPASLGAHPAFNWPLVAGVAKEAHELVFSEAETAPVWNVSNSVLTREDVPSPIAERRLPLRSRLATEDTTILHPPASRSLTYGPVGHPMIQVAWDGFAELAIWSRRDADLVCIEPWIGFTSPVGFDGEFRDKPGIMLLRSGEARTATHSITLLG